MRWVKRGKIFTAAGQAGWMQSHTQVPSALVQEDRIRIYFSTRPEDGMSRTTFVDVDIDDPSRILYLHERPILSLGEDGTFDEHGNIPNHVFVHDGKIHLFYVGWSRRQSVPYSNWMGLAISEDGTKFEKAFKGPILDRTPYEVYSATGLSCVKQGQHWQGWYATGTQWLMINGRYEHTYELRSCRSNNLIDWERSNQPIFPPRLPNESNTRPTVIYMDGVWHMWFCYRGTQDFRDGGDSYQIGYARSKDLAEWIRQDENAGIARSADGWDSKMMAYPCVVEARDRVFMFYSGNGFGRAGFGYAELEV